MSKELLFKKIKETQLEATFKLPLYRDSLNELSNDIINAAVKAANEATVVSSFELELFQFIKSTLGLNYHPQKETAIDTERHISKGRIDSKIGAFIIEFKHHSKLINERQKKSASKQIIEYLLGMYKEQETDYLGLITDGTKVKFIRCDSGVIFEEAFEPLNSNHLDRIIRNIILLEKTALTAGNLVKDFCVNEAVSNDLTKILYRVLEKTPTKKTEMLFKEWQELFRLAHDDESKQESIQLRRLALEEVVNDQIDCNEKEYRALFALQTAYAILIKIIAFKVISKINYNQSLINFNMLAEADSDTLRMQMSELEDGAIFRTLGIGNLLEGDFFSWYSTEQQWHVTLANLIKKIFYILVRYEDKAIFNKEDKVQDFFKDLYITMMPDKVRHSLGEFYTPSWLASNVLTDAIKHIDNKKNWKGIDPCCGSGTFITTMIGCVLNESEDLSKQAKLQSVLSRVKAIDLNPLAVLTARINYFINISHLIGDEDIFEIPVYLGDASYVPEPLLIDGVLCIKYDINTLLGPIEVLLPKSAISSSPKSFSRTMTSIEEDIKNLDEDSVFEKLFSLVDEKDKKQEIILKIRELSEKLISLQKNDWNGIWARILTNFLTTANLGHFDIIIGNPPWIDWKNLPAGYREKIKSLCISRDLFSGDSRTGGINLDICALISNVTAQNWLKDDGILAFLMPQKLLFQQSYEGFRDFKLNNGKKLYFQKFTDWTKSGHPFKPVQEKFLTFFVSSNPVDYKIGVPTKLYKIKKGENLSKHNKITNFEDIKGSFNAENILIGQCDSNSTKFSYAKSITHLKGFSEIAGISTYIGREGIEFYPQELFLLKPDFSMPINLNRLFLDNYQSPRSKYKVPALKVPMEKKFLHPLIKGINIERFHIREPEYLVPFPYDASNPKIPLSIKNLQKESPLLAKYFSKNKTVIESQTQYNAKIIGNNNAEYYALARVGKYSYAENHVVFRDNTKWQAAVVSDIETEWGGKRRPLFQNHAVSICEREDGSFISKDEAHYICAILNAPITKEYLMNSSDSRSFKIRPPIKIPLFILEDNDHKKLSELSKLAHLNYNNVLLMQDIDKELDILYLNVVNNR